MKNLLTLWREIAIGILFLVISGLVVHIYQQKAEISKLDADNSVLVVKLDAKDAEAATYKLSASITTQVVNALDEQNKILENKLANVNQSIILIRKSNKEALDKIANDQVPPTCDGAMRNLASRLQEEVKP